MSLRNWTASLLLTTALPLFAAEAETPPHPEQPMLWKVEGDALEKPSWLFGTIHVGSGPVVNLHPAAAHALEGSDVVYTEVAMDAASQLGMTKHIIRSDGRTLSDSIGEELVEHLNTELAAIQPGLNAAPFQSLKTWAVAVTVPMLKTQLEGGQPLDLLIWNQADERGKTTAALEKAADQFSIFDDLEEEEQVILLSESLRMNHEARLEDKDPVQALIDAYVAGDAKEIEAEMERQFTDMSEGEHRELGEKLLQRMLGDRNVSMARSIGEILVGQPDKSHFFAVGAGHYVGDDNIGQLLEKQGYRVTRVTE